MLPRVQCASVRGRKGNARAPMVARWTLSNRKSAYEAQLHGDERQFKFW